jgi:type I restriction enzyme, S subunit
MTNGNEAFSRVIMDSFLQPTLEAIAPQAAQKNINLEILRNLPLPVPPVGMQETFKKRCREVFSIRTQQESGTANAEATFDALLAKSFMATRTEGCDA